MKNSLQSDLLSKTAISTIYISHCQTLCWDTAAVYSQYFSQERDLRAQLRRVNMRVFRAKRKQANKVQRVRLGQNPMKTPTRSKPQSGSKQVLGSKGTWHKESRVESNWKYEYMCNEGARRWGGGGAGEEEEEQGITGGRCRQVGVTRSEMTHKRLDWINKQTDAHNHDKYWFQTDSHCFYFFSLKTQRAILNNKLSIYVTQHLNIPNSATHSFQSILMVEVSCGVTWGL